MGWAGFRQVPQKDENPGRFSGPFAVLCAFCTHFGQVFAAAAPARTGHDRIIFSLPYKSPGDNAQLSFFPKNK
jgi:hypothetical protein